MHAVIIILVSKYILLVLSSEYDDPTPTPIYLQFKSANTVKMGELIRPVNALSLAVENADPAILPHTCGWKN